MPINFIEPSFMTNEYKIYMSNVDYEKKFNELSTQEKEQIDILSELYINYIFTELEYYNSSNYTIPHTVFQDGLPIIFKIYVNKNIYNENDEKCRIGLNISMNLKNYINEDYMLYTIYYTNCILSEEEMKKYVANILFFILIICREFKYSPVLKYLCHQDDVDKLESIGKVHINLFGTNLDCSVCLDNCIDKTVCKHPICLKCYSHLDKKICPICRKVLKSESIETYVQLFLTYN